MDSTIATQAVRRALADREAASVREVQRLLDAGMAIMEEAGPGSPPRVADIVRRAELSNQAFYRHFASRDELVAAILERGARRLVGYAARQMATTDTPADAVRSWVVAVLSQAKPRVAAPTRAVLWNFSQLAGPRGDHVVATDAAVDDVRHLLDEPVRALGSTDVARDVTAIGDLTFGRLQHHLAGEPPTTADIDHVVAFCLAGLRHVDAPEVVG